VDLNKATIIGRITSAGPKMAYTQQGTPMLSFWLEVSERGKDGKVFTSYIPVEITGKLSEDIAESIEAGDELLIDGKLKYRSAGVTKDGKKAGGLVVTSWYVTKGQDAAAKAGSANCVPVLTDERSFVEGTARMLPILP
jgi:single-stranded DNA-binding protein